MKILSVVGARPNFMKIAPLARALSMHKTIVHQIVHTGQHYDSNMSDTFFNELDIPNPDISLGVGSGSHAVQTAQVMQKFEQVVITQQPDLVLVVGDVNSTLACALVAAKLHISVAHVEAGLRSFDISMPEEINRLLTDRISDFLFTTCSEANTNLEREGVSPEAVHFVGNVMIDTLYHNLKKIRDLSPCYKGKYAVLTLHRPSNVDCKDDFESILQAIQHIAQEIPIIFPAHPRTRKKIAEFGFESFFDNNITITDPIGYLDFLNIYSKAEMVLTDSGGIQEETSVLDIPCLSLRRNTERPITIELGTNILVGSDEHMIVQEAHKILHGERKHKKEIPLWDGNASSRIVEVLTRRLA